MTRYRVTTRRGVWTIDRFCPLTAEWVPLPREFDAPTAELAGRAVDAMVAMEKLKETT